MEWKDLVTQNFDSTLGVLELTLKGLNQADLNWQPKSDCNSIGWTTWHVSRFLDMGFSTLTGEEQLWIKDGWCEKFSRPADPADTGGRNTPDQVAAFMSPAPDTLIGYYRAVLEKAQNYLITLNSPDFDRKIDDRFSHVLPNVGSRIIRTLPELHQHLGQIAYIRGLLQGHGWVESIR